MSGPTMQQTQLGDAQLAAYKQASDLTKEQYSNQEAIYGPMATQFASIFAKGPGQQGFSQAETNDLNAQAVEGTADNFKGAEKALNESEAAEGGGMSSMPSGAEESQKAGLLESSAKEQSSEEQQIKQNDYTQGYNEWENAGQGLQSIAAGTNPLGYESNETGAGTAAGTTAGEIANEDDSWLNATIGAVGSAAGMASGASISKFG